MAHFICDNKKTEELLQKLLAVVSQEGAYIHENVGFVCKDGHFGAISSQKIGVQERVISIPDSATARVEAFRFSFDERISIVSASEDLSATEIEIMELAVEIYNLNQKLSHHRKSSILRLFYEDAVLFRTLTGYCKWKVFQGMDLKNEANCIGRNFMGLRAMERSKPGKTPVGTKLLLPFIEYFNNHPRASSVREYKDQKSAGFEIVANFPRGTNDLFISYGPYDSYDIFVLQGYVDASTFFVRSRPITISVLGLCTIEIDMHIESPKFSELPEELVGIAYYLPRIKVSDDMKKIYFSHLLIPSRLAPQAMRRILRFIFGALAATGEEIHRAVLDAEKQIIDRNLDFYDDLSTYLESYKASPSVKAIIDDFKKVIELQVQKIEDYKSFLRLPD